jgi:hypothetical protein
VQTAYIEPDSPWENGYCESFNGEFRNRLLDGAATVSRKQSRLNAGATTITMLGFRPPARFGMFIALFK